MFKSSNTKQSNSSNSGQEPPIQAAQLQYAKPSNNIPLINLSAYEVQEHLSSHFRTLLPNKSILDNNSPTTSIKNTLAACTINESNFADIKLVYR